MLLEKLDENLLHSVREALAEDIGSGDITARLIPEETIATAQRYQPRAGHPLRHGLVQCRVCRTRQQHPDCLGNTGWQPRRQRTRCSARSPDPHVPCLPVNAPRLISCRPCRQRQRCARRYADRVADLPVKILDTRKTIPGLRQAQKYAVRSGGCHNHRTGLYDGILIKENHITAAGSIAQAVINARGVNPGMPVEVEVEDMAQITAALEAGAERLLLDNFSLEALREAVRQVAGRAELEASGGINIDNLRDIALTGVDYISIGSLTKNIHAIDLSMIFTS